MVRKSKVHVLHPASGGTATALKRPFNERATDVSEFESKFLVKADKGLQVFDAVKSYFKDLGWIRRTQPCKQLLSSQLDTPKRALLRNGHSIRVRGFSSNADLNDIKKPDICLKTGKKIRKSAATERGEYEARTASFQKPNLADLVKKYPSHLYPELHDILDTFAPEDLVEHFRIDCLRTRLVLEVPEDVTGLKGKTVIAELELDDVVYVVDTNVRYPIILGTDLEIECEILFKPCEFDDAGHSEAQQSSPLTREEIEQAMTAIKKYILAAGQGGLFENHDSKAERGFAYLDRTRDDLQKAALPGGASEQAASALNESDYKRFRNRLARVMARHTLALSAEHASIHAPAAPQPLKNIPALHAA